MSYRNDSASAECYRHLHPLPTPASGSLLRAIRLVAIKSALPSSETVGLTGTRHDLTVRMSGIALTVCLHTVSFVKNTVTLRASRDQLDTLRGLVSVGLCLAILVSKALVGDLSELTSPRLSVRLSAGLAPGGARAAHHLILLDALAPPARLVLRWGWWRVLGLLQTLLACWHGTYPVCRRELPPEHPLRTTNLTEHY